MRYTVGDFFFQKQHNIVSLQHMVLPIIRKEWQSVCTPYMENRITQWINSASYDKGTNLIRHIFVIKGMTS